MEVDFIRYIAPHEWRGADPWKTDDIAAILEAVNERIDLLGGSKNYIFPYQMTRYAVIESIRSFLVNNIGRFYDLDFDENHFDKYKSGIVFPKMLSLSDFEPDVVRAIYELPSSGSPAKEFIPFLTAVPKVLKKMRAVLFSGTVMTMKYYGKAFREQIGIELDSVQQFVFWNQFTNGFNDGNFVYHYPGAILAAPVVVEDIDIDEKFTLKTRLKSMKEYWELYEQRKETFISGLGEPKTFMFINMTKLKSVRSKIFAYLSKSSFAGKDVDFLRTAINYAVNNNDAEVLELAQKELEILMMYDDTLEKTSEETKLLESLSKCLGVVMSEGGMTTEAYWYHRFGLDFLDSGEYWGMRNPLKFTSFMEIGRGMLNCDKHVDGAGQPASCPSYLNVKRDAIRLLGTSKPHPLLSCNMLFRYTVQHKTHPSRAFVLDYNTVEVPAYEYYFYVLYGEKFPSNVQTEYKEGVYKVPGRFPWTEKLTLDKWFGDIHWRPQLNDIKKKFAPPVTAYHMASMLGFEGQIYIICDFGVSGGLKFL